MMIDYECLDGYTCSVNSDCITHIDKGLSPNITIIHLNNGKTIATHDSVKTLNARINSLPEITSESVLCDKCGGYMESSHPYGHLRCKNCGFIDVTRVG